MGPPLGSIPRTSRSDSTPLSFAQQQVWRQARLEAGSSMPPVSFALRMRGALNEGVLERALEAIVARHEVLRTRYTEGPNGPVQRIEEATPVELARVDLREMGLEERQQRLEGVIAERQQPFDATVGPMMRATLV
ncbi:MAG TPA: condensation domain-containing protein, partial [Myxococcaceae bacterium]|nr:condensation domain-containing protein [Myxococcaceae bacterium]